MGNTHQKECAGSGCLQSTTAAEPHVSRKQTKAEGMKTIKILSVTGSRCSQLIKIIAEFINLQLAPFGEALHCGKMQLSWKEIASLGNLTPLQGVKIKKKLSGTGHHILTDCNWQTHD